MEFDDLANLIKNRRSIRAWQDKEVSEELLIQAIELATWAPNGGNQQNWHFYIIVNRDTIKAIGDAVQASADIIISWPEANEFEDLTTRLRERASFFRNAPAAIGVAAAQYQSPIDEVLAAREKVDPIARQMRQGRNSADSRIQSVASAIAYLLLILHRMGMGAVWMTGPLQVKGEIEKILKVPPELDIVAFIPVGYPAESPVPKERRPLRDIYELVK
ncbi:nitroreductase family protein [Chloroflexota bacterium]